MVQTFSIGQAGFRLIIDGQNEFQFVGRQQIPAIKKRQREGNAAVQGGLSADRNTPERIKHAAVDACTFPRKAQSVPGFIDAADIQLQIVALFTDGIDDKRTFVVFKERRFLPVVARDHRCSRCRRCDRLRGIVLQEKEIYRSSDAKHSNGHDHPDPPARFALAIFRIGRFKIDCLTGGLLRCAALRKERRLRSTGPVRHAFCPNTGRRIQLAGFDHGCQLCAGYRPLLFPLMNIIPLFASGGGCRRSTSGVCHRISPSS